MTGSDQTTTTFQAAANGFVQLAGVVQPSQWGEPALGVWDVRGLVGHTARALSTVETYLTRSPGEPTISSPAEYFVAALNDRGDSEVRRRQDDAIAERGRSEGSSLGPNPIERLVPLATRILILVESADAQALVLTPFGTITLANYLPTRTFELTVHSLDLARALKIEHPASLDQAIRSSCELAGQIAAQRCNSAELLRFFTGRKTTPEALSIL
ncbi:MULTISPECIES: maleylpyruvate isomerase N-terminal domain-containing protein [Ferrimicrobium]|jgi:hypothetical protein|uniref:Maleylpyruvate isomerase N-terminal domain-containing protein n=1 Tax=Ferrimicrobium acidiphilum TaxID=121039 RepID=A0ABV3Y674_9ACTN|nr:maleylpyruvate isomerase N-terminal domain-containing protein [Ferrimicrobium sp.]MCL5053135.1 maleylpyruvate isomerase N-terminal domain-containing protein [Gammaproteobacteria bacterium]